MHTGNEREPKVVSLADRNNAKKKSEEENSGEDAELAPDFGWSDVMKRNAENASRLKKEREKANKGVIRSYRLKH